MYKTGQVMLYVYCNVVYIISCYMKALLCILQYGIFHIILYTSHYMFYVRASTWRDGLRDYRSLSLSLSLPPTLSLRIHNFSTSLSPHFLVSLTPRPSLKESERRSLTPFLGMREMIPRLLEYIYIYIYMYICSRTGRWARRT
jgi:hypothetical protein